MLHLTVDAIAHKLEPGGYAYLPPGADWTVRNEGGANAHFHWIRKAYERVEGLDVPEAFVTNERDVEAGSMPDTDGSWRTTRFVDPADLRHDMHVNIVTFEPGTVIPFAETHVMEHGLYVLEGKAVYRLNEDWVEVRGRRLHVAARVLPAGLLRRWSGPVPLPALQGRQPAHEAEQSHRLSRPTCSGRPPELEPHPLAAGVLLAAPAVGHGRDEPQAVAALRRAGRVAAGAVEPSTTATCSAARVRCTSTVIAASPATCRTTFVTSSLTSSAASSRYPSAAQAVRRWVTTRRAAGTLRGTRAGRAAARRASAGAWSGDGAPAPGAPRTGRPGRAR